MFSNSSSRYIWKETKKIDKKYTGTSIFPEALLTITETMATI